MPPAPRLLMAPQVAARLGFRRRVFCMVRAELREDQCGYALAREGIIPVVRIGRQVRVDREQLATWIEGGGQELGTQAEAGGQTPRE